MCPHFSGTSDYDNEADAPILRYLRDLPSGTEWFKTQKSSLSEIFSITHLNH